MLWGTLLFEGATIAVYNAVFRGGYYSSGLINKGGIYSRKYGSSLITESFITMKRMECTIPLRK